MCFGGERFRATVRRVVRLNSQRDVQNATLKGKVTVNNASIWRSVLGIGEAIRRYSGLSRPTRASAACSTTTLSTPSGTWSRKGLRNSPAKRIAVEIKDLQDFRTYKVTWQKASAVPRFEQMLTDIRSHRKSLGDLNQEKHYDIRCFKQRIWP
jgi:hypothetical protein